MVAGWVRSGDTGGDSRTLGIGQSGATIQRVSLTEVPLEVAETLARVRVGGPFLSLQDGAIFFNRQQHLPQREAGYYREYTVETPGSPNRRLVVGGGGAELYYTDDHYRTFREVAEADD